MKSFLYGQSVWDNIRWITFLWTTLAVLIVVQSVCGEKTCGYDDIVTMQKLCKSENEKLLEAEESDDNRRLCESLHSVWFCVARNVPRCFYNVSAYNEHYTHSPHYCNLSQSQFLKLQEIIRSNSKKDTTVLLPVSVSGAGKYETVTSDSKIRVKDGQHSNQQGNNSVSSSLHTSYSVWTFMPIYTMMYFLSNLWRYV